MPVDDSAKLEAQIVQLAGLALQAGGHQASPLVRRFARSHRDSRPELSRALIGLLRTSPTRQLATSAAPLTQPVDNESRLPLVREEDPVVLGVEPILDAEIRASLEQLVREHESPDRLLEAGLSPTRTALFVGPPGVGKTIAARWLAMSLGLPLIVLDLASVMSSLLGRTGENVRRVLEYAKQTPCILLLDELDAVAKRRDDVGEIGELKRLVTVLLQEIDAWPEGSLLLAATNHPDLLDPAVWRRFEVTLEFALPDDEQLRQALRQYADDAEIAGDAIEMMAVAFSGSSYSDVERDVMRSRRLAAMTGISVEKALVDASQDRIRNLPSSDRIRLATNLVASGMSQRRANQVTHVSRDTLRKYSATRGPTGE